MKRANEANRLENKVISYTTASQCLNSDWDLVILATTAEARLGALKKLLDCSSVKSIILEKF